MCCVGTRKERVPALGVLLSLAEESSSEEGWSDFETDLEPAFDPQSGVEVSEQIPSAQRRISENLNGIRLRPPKLQQVGCGQRPSRRRAELARPWYQR